MVNRSSYNVKSDIWSLGCLIYELCALVPPFLAANQKMLSSKIQEGHFKPIPSHYSGDLQRIIERMLTVVVGVFIDRIFTYYTELSPQQTGCIVVIIIAVVIIKVIILAIIKKYWHPSSEEIRLFLHVKTSFSKISFFYIRITCSKLQRAKFNVLVIHLNHVF